MITAFLCCVLTSPGAVQATHQDLEHELAQVRALTKAGNWGPALEALQSALEVHGDQPYACWHWAEIEEALVRGSFWKEYEPPKAKKVVPGELRSWKASSGAIKLRYRRADRKKKHAPSKLRVRTRGGRGAGRARE